MIQDRATLREALLRFVGRHRPGRDSEALRPLLDDLESERGQALETFGRLAATLHPTLAAVVESAPPAVADMAKPDVPADSAGHGADESSPPGAVWADEEKDRMARWLVGAGSDSKDS